MATSGSFNTSSYSDSSVTRYLTFSWSRTSYSVANNTSTIYWKVVGSGSPSSHWVTTRPIQVKIDGEEVFYSNSPVDVYGDGSVIYVGGNYIEGYKTFTHDNNGNRSFSAVVKAGIFYHSLDYCTGSRTFELNNIPRYATISQTISSRTETEMTIAWSSAQTVTSAEYCVNDGAWVTLSSSDTTGGSFSLTNLVPGITYKIKYRTTRKDSGLTGVTDAFDAETYAWPYANSTPNFEVGKSVKIGVYNPLGHTFTLTMIGADGSTKTAGSSYSGTSVSGFYSSAWKDFWFSSCPSATSGQYSVRITYDGHTSTTEGGTYTFGEAALSPDVQSFSYADISAYAGITGDSSIIVQNRSTVRYTVTPKLMASATAETVTIEVNGKTYTLAPDGSNFIGGDEAIDSGSKIKAKVSIVDSRGYSCEREFDVEVQRWEPPTAIFDVHRDSGYYTATKLKVNADYSYVSGTNAVTITYKARKHGTSTFTVTGTAPDNEEVTFNADNQFIWDVRIIVQDLFGGSVTYNTTVNKGIPLIFFDHLHNSVGIGKFPSGDNTLEVVGLTDDVATEINNLKAFTPPTAWTPTFRWSNNSSITVENISCRYEKYGPILIMGGRFQITYVGNPTDEHLLISIPDGLTMNSHGVQIVGTFFFPDGTAKGCLRVYASDATKLALTAGPSGLYSSGIITDTGYYAFTATATLA